MALVLIGCKMQQVGLRVADHVGVYGNENCGNARAVGQGGQGGNGIGGMVTA